MQSRDSGVLITRLRSVSKRIFNISMERFEGLVRQQAKRMERIRINEVEMENWDER